MFVILNVLVLINVTEIRREMSPLMPMIKMKMLILIMRITKAMTFVKIMMIVG